MKYTNPVIKGFNPDPSVCRVGDDYYLVTSTFEYFPGIPVYHSVDLVNWVQIGNCIERPEQLPFDIAEPDKGIWAPTIRYYGGKFYVTAKFMGFGNFIVSSEDPASGWSDPVKVDIDGIDPSILFDGGKAYYCTNAKGADNAESISLAEINADTGEIQSGIKQIWNGGSTDKPQYLEAPHIYRKDDWYYLVAAEGGTGKNHMITCARSKNIWGPYENCSFNPILTNINDNTQGVACSGHGDFVEDTDGNWWCFHLATRPDDEWYSHMGRETFLLPVLWRDEWPVIADGKSHIEYEINVLKSVQIKEKIWQADFSVIEPKWLFLRNPVKENYILSDGVMTMKPSEIKISDKKGSPTMALIRQPDIECVISAEFDFDTKENGDSAGMTLYISSSGYYTFSKQRINSKDYLVIAKNGSDFEPRYMDIENGRLTLRIESSKKSYDLYYCVAGGGYVHAGSVPVLTAADAGKCFTGTLVGLFAQCENETSAEMKVYSFKTEI